MTRKYYKENVDATAVKVDITYECPNTKDQVKVCPDPWDFNGYEDRMGNSVNVDVQCRSCGKNHTIYLRDD